MSHRHHPDDTGAIVYPQGLVKRLRELGEEMPDALHAQFFAAGPAIIPDLLAVLEDDQVEDGWAPLHAAKLLGVLGDARAVPVLLRCLEQCDALDPLTQQVIDALVAMGKLAIDGCLEAYATTTDDDTRDSIAVVLSRCGTQDKRIFEVLLDILERSPMLGANCLVDYGDSQAISGLSQQFPLLA